MKLSAILAPLIAAKVPHSVILETVQAWEDQQDAIIDESKEKARARWHKWKAKQTQANVSKRLPTTANDLCEGVTRGEDNLQTKKISGQEEKKERSPKKATRLPEGWQLPDEWREEAITAGLPANRVDIEVRKMVNWSRSSKAGAKLDWRAAWRNWVQRQIEETPPRSTSPPPRKQTVGQQARDELKRMGMMPNAPDSQTRYRDESDGSADFAGVGLTRRFAIAASR